jgi:glycerophosphoryl diester phosphodiesterase
LPRQWGVFMFGLILSWVFPMADWPGPLPRLIGHRGAAAVTPENTLSSIRAAATAGARWVEVDARLTADSVPVLMHDETLDRTTDGTGRVRGEIASAIAALHAGAWFDRKFEGIGVPTLEQAATLASQLGLGLNVELKPDADSVSVTGELVARSLVGHNGQLLVSCFDPDCLEAAARAAPALALALNAEAATVGTIDLACGLGCCALHISKAQASPAALEAITRAGMVPGVFTVNDLDAAKSLLALGASYVFTDDPAQLASI